MSQEQIPNLFESSTQSGPVECLGLTFENDDARREHFLAILREKLKDPEFRKIEGFPIGEDEDILALSDPPYYTACPNPFLEDFIRCYGKPYDPETDNYHREPFAADVSEGKNDPIYNAHSYHTKVPHKAIMRYILHYTEPGDIVFDGFCGTGMTGVAAQLCGDKEAVKSLGYSIGKDGEILDESGKEFSRLGVRKAMLNDISPLASFVSYNYNSRVSSRSFQNSLNFLINKLNEEIGWCYLTLHNPNDLQVLRAINLSKDNLNKLEDSGFAWGTINYIIWSDVFRCNNCSQEVVFWNEAIDKASGEVKSRFECSHCKVLLTKREIERVETSDYDVHLQKIVKKPKQVPVLVNYSYGKKRLNKKPDKYDLAVIEIFKQKNADSWFPIDSMMHVKPGTPWGDEWRPGRAFEYVHHLLFDRSNHILSLFLHEAKQLELCDHRTNLASILCLTSSLVNSTRMYRWRSNGKGGTVSGTYYLPSTPQEMNVISQIHAKAKMLEQAFRVCNSQEAFVEIRASQMLSQKENSVDYIFLDPPFGANLAYSELNFLWESWLKIFTNIRHEAIENKTQGKTLEEYRRLMK